MSVTLGWSNFAKGRHSKGKGYSYSSLSDEDVVRLTLHNWDERLPGQGEVGLDRKIIVPIKNSMLHLPSAVPAEPHFYCGSALLQEGMILQSDVHRRQEGEDLFIKTVANNALAQEYNDALHESDHSPLAVPEAAHFVNVVCYSAEALLENGGERTTDDDWEIVCIIASPIEKEPMHPLAMARNFLEKPGGTKSEYTAQEFAEAIYYWSQRVSVE